MQNLLSDQPMQAPATVQHDPDYYCDYNHADCCADGRADYYDDNH